MLHSHSFARPRQPFQMQRRWPSPRDMLQWDQTSHAPATLLQPTKKRMMHMEKADPHEMKTILAAFAFRDAPKHAQVHPVRVTF